MLRVAGPELFVYPVKMARIATPCTRASASGCRESFGSPFTSIGTVTTASTTADTAPIALAKRYLP